jgi:hypothetical protein
MTCYLCDKFGSSPAKVQATLASADFRQTLPCGNALAFRYPIPFHRGSLETCIPVTSHAWRTEKTASAVWKRVENGLRLRLSAAFAKNQKRPQSDPDQHQGAGFGDRGHGIPCLTDSEFVEIGGGGVGIK